MRPTVQAVLERLEPAPAFVVNHLGDLLAWTDGYERLARPLGILDGDEPNLLWFTFGDERARTAFPDWDDVADEQIANLRAELRGPDDDTRALADHLARVAGADFTDRWDRRPVVVAGVAPTLRAANRQYAQIAADLGYAPPSFNAFDRLTDVDTALRSFQDLGGTAVNIDCNGGGPVDVDDRVALLELESVERPRLHRPAGDVYFGGAVQAAPVDAGSALRGRVAAAVNFVVGASFSARRSIPIRRSRRNRGCAAARFLLAPTAAAATPGLLDGYGYQQFVRFGNVSAALFGQIEWSLTDRLRLLPGLRFNYDQKDVDFDQQIYGGLADHRSGAHRSAAF